MFRRSKAEKVRESALSASELALQLAQDEKFRKRLLSAIEHGAQARRRVRRGLGLADAARRLAADQALRAELRDARRDLEQAYARLDAKRRSHRLRTIAMLAGLASLAALPRVRERVSALVANAPTNRTRADDSARAHTPRELEDLTKQELYMRAQEAGIPGRSEMSKEQLIAALRARG